MAKPAWAQKKLKQMDEQQSGGGDFYEWKDGANILRILPSWKGEDEQFYVEDAIHYKIGPDKVRVKCRKLIGKPCAVCEMSEKAFKAGDKDGGRNFRAKARYYTNAVDLNSPKSGVQCAAFGPQVLKQILTYLVDEDDEWGEWWHAKGRYDFKVVKKGDGMDTEYTVFPTRKFVDVKTDKAVAKDLEALGSKVPSYEEQKAILAGDEFEPEEEDEEVEAEEDEEEEAPKKKKAKKPAAEEEDEEETAEEDAEEPEEEPEAEEDADEEEEAPKKKSKKAKAEEDDEEEPEEDAEEEAEESPEAPACFKDPGQHDPEDDICTDCEFFKECGKAVAAKIKAEPKKYAKAPLALLKKDEDDEDDEEEVEKELKKSVAKGKVAKKGSRK